jgi:fatty acid synthase
MSGKLLIDVHAGKGPNSIRPMYSTSGTHMITGGLGGFGLELAAWLVSCGAEKVLLLSRTGNTTGYQNRKIAWLPQLQVVRCDVTSYDDVKSCMLKYPAITSIWHLAMTLHDALYSKMTENQWNECVRVKVDAAKYLDTLSLELLPNLKDFVMFSSISSLFGNGGQTNYAYANAALEQLGYHRHADNLPAKVICWGVIGNVGYVSNKGKINADMIVEEQHIDICLSDLHIIMTTSSPVVSCYKPVQINASLTNGTAATCLDSILRVLGVDPTKVSDSDSLADLGVDSLQVVTIKSILKGRDKEIPVTGIYDMKISELKLFN